MDYVYYKNLLKVAEGFDDFDKFVGEVGFPEQITLGTDQYVKALHIIFAVANGKLRDAIEGYKISYVHNLLDIPRSTFQDWIYGNSNISKYDKQLIGFALISL